MLNPFKNLFGRPSESVLGVDVGTSSVKIVQLKRRGGRAILETYGSLSLGPYANTEIGRATNLPIEKIEVAVMDLLKEASVTTNKCGIAIPFNSCLMSVIEMPDVDNKQLEHMVPIEVRKYIPVPITEVILDWWVVPRDEKNLNFEDESNNPNKAPKFKKIDVLIVAIHKEIINKYEEIVARTGLQSSFFEIEIFSTIRAVVDQNSVPVMILDMGAGTTKLYIVEKGVIRNSHIINRGSQDISLSISKSIGVPVDKAEILKRDYGTKPGPYDNEIRDIVALVTDSIFSESNRVLLNFEKRYNKKVSKVILTGGGVGLVGLPDVAKENFQIPVEKADPFSKMEAPAFLEDVLKKVGPEFSVAAGAALRRLQEIG